MLTKLTLRNFRGFDHHEIPLRDSTVIVGKNNAGKSTIVEALRFVSIVVSRYRSLNFHPCPEWTGGSQALYGVRPSLRNMEINFDLMFHQYAEPPAIIQAQFSDGQSVCVYLADGERIHGILRDENGKVIKTRQKANETDLPTVSIMPQVAPLQKRETILSGDYVRNAMSSSLAPLHFRNQLSVRYDLFPEFCQTVAETWPGVMVKELIGRGGLPGDNLYLEVRNEDFEGEVGLMGHGLQMWLQTMWFLTLSRGSDTVILDEPDVYMHPDLQRRVVRFLRRKHSQCIITTHSTEILSEVDAEEVLVVDRARRCSAFASTMPAVQKIVDNIGSVHNIQMARLWRARRFVMVEGKDISILKALQNTLYPESDSPIDTIPHMSIGGWGGWPQALGSATVLKNAMDEEITVYCILDSDYHTIEEIEERRASARKRNVELHVWSMKEIENLLLVPTLICRTIRLLLPSGVRPPTEEQVQAALQAITYNLRDQVLDGLATGVQSRDRSLTPATANRQARDRLEEVVQQDGHFRRLCPGKEVLAKVSDWCQKKFRVHLNALGLARNAHRDEIDGELEGVLFAIENAQSFSRKPPSGASGGVRPNH